MEAREPEGKGCHVEPVIGVARVQPEMKKGLLINTQLVAISGKISAHEIQGKNIGSRPGPAYEW